MFHSLIFIPHTFNLEVTILQLLLKISYHLFILRIRDIGDILLLLFPSYHLHVKVHLLDLRL